MGLFKRANYKAVKFNGQFIFTNFGYGVYGLEVPRNLEEQLASLAIVGGRNVMGLKGNLVNQYGFFVKGAMDEHDYPLQVSTNSNTQNIFIISINGNVYYYTNLDGLKQYKTKLTDLSDMIIAHNGLNLYISSAQGNYVFGGRYIDESDDDVTFVPIIQSREAVEQTGIFLTLPVTEQEIKYLWLEKKLVIEDSGTDYPVNVSSISTNDDDTYPYLVTFRFTDTTITWTNSSELGEKTLHELTTNPITGLNDLWWYPEDYDPENPQGDMEIKPKLMEVALNRLWIVDEENRIFYSAVGNLTNFDQADGAGYFEGFYQDTSDVLSIEEYFSGVLITKQTGMYHIRLTTNEYSFSGGGTVIAQGTSENYLNINKVNNIPQKYAGDHVIIGDEVIAYDYVSGNLWQAAYVNYFGNLQQGGILLHGSEMDNNSLGLQSTDRRVLVYNYQEEVLLLYYGHNLSKALLITRDLSIFPRETSLVLKDALMFNQGFICISQDGVIIEDFKRGTSIPDVSSVAEFEPIALKGNKMLCGSAIEVTELNVVDFYAYISNAGGSEQKISRNTLGLNTEVNYPNLIYSDKNLNIINSSFAEETKWAYQKSSVIRFCAPLGGRDGLKIRLEFPENISFILSALNFPDLTRGE